MPPQPSTEPDLEDPASASSEAPAEAVPQSPGWIWKRLWTSPDPDLVDAGLRGEWLIAGIRLLTVLLLLSLPLHQYLQSPGAHRAQAALWVAVAALAEALVIYSAVMRSWGRSWIGFFSGILDVSLVTLCLLIFVRVDDPIAATSDLVFFPLYLLAIGATSLRFDWRICVLTGCAAVAQYAALVAYVAWMWGAADPDAMAAGGFSWRAQLGRLVLLVMATLLATSLVVRAREQKRLSTRDRLTNLANRGFFDDSLLRLGAVAERSGDPVSVAMIDVDRFKRFNDTHGHLAGDEALKEVAAALGLAFRTTDLIARYGGEEFACVFPGLGSDAAAHRMEKLRLAIEARPIPIGDGAARVTVSIGLAAWPMDGDNLLQTLAIADDRLYRAKQTGRNRLVTSSETDTVPVDVPAGMLDE
jgi:diguanylate cyclase (GGDEF)-like protein